jgi:hypothetical protein
MKNKIKLKRESLVSSIFFESKFKLKPKSWYIWEEVIVERRKDEKKEK